MIVPIVRPVVIMIRRVARQVVNPALVRAAIRYAALVKVRRAPVTVAYQAPVRPISTTATVVLRGLVTQYIARAAATIRSIAVVLITAILLPRTLVATMSAGAVKLPQAVREIAAVVWVSVLQPCITTTPAVSPAVIPIVRMDAPMMPRDVRLGV